MKAPVNELHDSKRPNNFGRKVSVGFLLREGFTQARRGKSSGWEYHNLISREHSPGGHVYDITQGGHTAMYKRFLCQEEENFTVDIRLETSGLNSGSQIAVKSGDEFVVLLEINRDNLYYVTEETPREALATLTENQLTGLRIKIDLKNKNASILVNGITVLDNAALYKEISAADTIYFGSVDDGCTDYIVRAIEIYKGFVVYENLFHTLSTEIPEPWIYEYSGSGKSVCESYDYAPMAHGLEFTVFRLALTEPADSLKLGRYFSMSGSGVYEFDFYLEKSPEGFEVEFYGDSGYLGFFTKGGDLCFRSVASKSEAVLITGVKMRVWYRIQLLLDCEDRMLTINTNGFEAYSVALGDQASVITGNKLIEGEFSSLTFRLFPGSFGDVLVDRICVSPMLARREVPAPEIVDTKDLIVNMQVCNLWREGTHTGWRVYPGKYENRKPILGWYDEGDPEVADWEIKWALEHGIKSFMYCWYRPHNGPIPIKQGYLDEQLWSGYFNSRFKKDFNFTVMFTNHNVFNIESADDMIDNVMPYLIEVFFRNPNYLKTADNKPILYIYELRELLDKLGDPAVEGSRGTPADVRAMFDRMREVTKHAGFGGLVILGEYRGKDPEFIRKMSDAGYDYSFAYTWHPETKGMSHDAMLSQIKDYLNTQRKLYKEYGDTTQVIPNVSVAWDPTAWNLDYGRDPGTTFTFDLEHLEALLRFARDEFGTPVFADNKTKMIMIDNWNEYGEGHYFLPAYGTPAYDLDEHGKARGDHAKKGKKGFGWLDCIRRVYGASPFEHIDHWPLEEGFGPYDKWFPPAWEEEHIPRLD
jgi:hypothetical protein